MNYLLAMIKIKQRYHLNSKVVIQNTMDNNQLKKHSGELACVKRYSAAYWGNKIYFYLLVELLSGKQIYVFENDCSIKNEII